MCLIVMEDKMFHDTAPLQTLPRTEKGGEMLVSLFFSCSPISLDNPVSTDPGGWSLQESVPVHHRGEQGRDVRATSRCLA